MSYVSSRLRVFRTLKEVSQRYRTSYPRISQRFYLQQHCKASWLKNNIFAAFQTIKFILPFRTGTTILSLGFLSKQRESEMSDLQTTIEKADVLFINKKTEELYNFLKEAVEKEEFKNAEVYWRLARACREMANLQATDKEKNKAFMYEGFDNAKKGLDLDSEHWACNKWYGILMDLTSRFEGTKKRIEGSYIMKEHLMKASEKNPTDATTMHALGVWCFEVADLSWIMRKAAAAFFATPPQSSYDEALKYLLEAEKTDPNFYSHNLLYIGKAYLRLNKKAEAKEYLEKALNFDGSSFDDQKAKEEAKELLKKC